MREPNPDQTEPLPSKSPFNLALDETLGRLDYTPERADAVRDRLVEEVDSMIAADHSPGLAWRLAFINATAEDDRLLDTPFAEAVTSSRLDPRKDTLRFEESEPEIGESGPIKTNNTIKTINKDAEQGRIGPKKFFESAVETVRTRRQSGIDRIGPENLSTAAHYYYKLVRNDDNEEVEPLEDDVVEQWATMLKDTTRREHLNKVGIGNIMKSIGLLRDQLPEDFYSVMYREAGHSLAHFSHQTAMMFYRGLSETPTSELHHGYLALFQIAQRMQPVYERTNDLRHSLGALAQFDGRIVPDHTYQEVLEKGRTIDETLGVDDLGFCGLKALEAADKIPGDRTGITQELLDYAAECHEGGRQVLKTKSIIAAHEKDEALKETRFAELRQEMATMKRLGKTLHYFRTRD